MDDQPAPGMGLLEVGSSGGWILSASVKKHVIDDDIKVAVMLKRSPKELRDHLVLESHSWQKWNSSSL